MAAGQLSRWGDSTYYQTGSGSTAAIAAPTVLGSDNWLDVAAGWYHTIALKSDGSLWGWGYNADGEVGDNSTITRQTPFQIHVGVFTKVACGKYVSFAVKSDGTLWGWGGGGWGQMGSGGYSDVLVPAQIGVATWTSVAAGEVHVLAIKSDGTLWAWGTGYAGQLGLGATTEQLAPAQIGVATTWVKLAAGYRASFGIKSDGTLWGWGENTSGELGDGTATDHDAPTQIGVATNWASVASGQYHSLAVKTDGTLWCTGYNVVGQLGDGTTVSTSTFAQVGVATNWVQVSCRANQSIALKADGTLWVAGENSMYQLGTGVNTDVTGGFTQVGTGEYQIVAAGDFHSAAILVWVPTTFVIESVTDFAHGTDALADTMQLTTDGAGASDALTGGQTNSQTASDTAAGVEVFVRVYSVAQTLVDTASSSDGLGSATFTMYLEAIGQTDSFAAGANTTSALSDSTTLTDNIQQAINQIVADTATGTGTFSLGAALTLVDIAEAVATQTSTYNSVMLVAELIATLEAYNSVPGYDIAEAGTLTDAYVARVSALVALLESAQAVDVNTGVVHVMQTAADDADGATTITSTGSLLNALLADSALVTVRINIGGELFTGWVLNTDTMAPSEYQFADRQFNSACKHGTRYLMAADDGIYEFTDDAGVESVMTYIKTGKTDFGSDLKKRVVNSYMVYSASGQMVLKVTTSEFGNLVTRNYRMTPQAGATTDTRRVDIGKGVTSRYWQFEVVGDGVDCDIDEIGMLPVVLSRRL